MMSLRAQNKFMVKNEAIRVRHILDAANKIVGFTDNRQRQDLDDNEMLTLALVRLIEVVGEASKHVSWETRKQNPNIPWKQMCGIRDRLIHAYFEINLDIVWGVCTQNIPAMIPDLESLLEELTEC